MSYHPEIGVLCIIESEYGTFEYLAQSETSTLTIKDPIARLELGKEIPTYSCSYHTYYYVGNKIFEDGHEARLYKDK